MKTKHIFSVLSLATAMIAQASWAAVVVDETFDGYADQAAFEAAWAPIGSVAPSSASLSIEQSVSPSNSVKVGGFSTISPTGATAQRNRLTFADTGITIIGSSLTFSFDFYDSSAAASPYRQYSNLQDTIAPGSTNQLVSMGLSNNQSSANSGGNYYMARILGYTVPTTADPDGGPAESVGGAGAYFKLNDFGAGLRSTGWHNLKVVLSTDDGLSTDYSFYVDNVLAERVSNIGTAASIRQYDNIVVGSGLTNANNAAYYDNFSLVFAVPEAGSLAAFGVFGLASLGGVWLRRRAA
jgi:hypothetical protein